MPVSTRRNLQLSNCPDGKYIGGMIKMTTLSGNLVDTVGLASQLRVATDTVRKWVQRGLLKPKCSIGRAYLFDEPEINRFLAEKRPPGNPNLRKSG